MATSADIVLARIINGILAIIVFFLGFRILFQLFSANPNTPFVAWVYDISRVILAPFSGIFPSQSVGQGVLDLPALIALIVYALLAQIVIALLGGIVRSRHTVIHTDHDNAI